MDHHIRAYKRYNVRFHALPNSNMRGMLGTRFALRLYWARTCNTRWIWGCNDGAFHFCAFANKPRKHPDSGRTQSVNFAVSMLQTIAFI